MNEQERLVLPETRRMDLVEELHQRFGGGNKGMAGIRRRLRFWRKKYAWLVVTRSAQLLKRGIDIVASSGAMLVLSPVFLTVAACIKLTDGGSVFFFQKRVGRWGREFTFPKFRSMVANAEELKKKLLAQSDHGGESITFKMKNDPRITWIGRFIRKLSIDELPQLWCVFVGQMTLVGPRPPTVNEVAEYTLADRRRLDVVPGLTCFWQVEGRGDIPFPEQVKLDVKYIESRKLTTDLVILLKTVPAVLLGKGAY
jgi:lipopolysaccharide/colanic/teichoic acid biosynthesis glycosyltransferase